MHKCNHKLPKYRIKLGKTCLTTFSKYAVPWDLLLKDKYFKNYVDHYNYCNSQQLKEYRQDEIVGAEWIEVEEYTGIEKVVTESTQNNYKNLDYEESPQKRFFKPKFRMVIGLGKDNKDEETGNLP